MFEVTVEDTFAAGHYLRNYKGKCENPHGHNYKIRVTLAGAELDKAGLLLDFKDLREVMRHVIERLDHQMINEIEPFTVINPSAENLAKYFYDRVQLASAERHKRAGASEGCNRIRDGHDDGKVFRVVSLPLRARHPATAAWAVLPMQITEIYKSLQGESTHAGLPCVFVRLDGLQPAVFVVRQRVHVPGRPQNGDRRSSGRGRATESGRWVGRDHRRRTHAAGTRGCAADAEDSWTMATRCCSKPAGSGRWSVFRRVLSRSSM